MSTNDIKFEYKQAPLNIFERILLMLAHGGPLGSHSVAGDTLLEHQFAISQHQREWASAMNNAELNSFIGWADWLKQNNINIPGAEDFTQKIHDFLVKPGGMGNAFYSWAPPRLRHALAGGRGDAYLALRDFYSGYRGLTDAYGESVLGNEDYTRLFAQGYANISKDDPTGFGFEAMQDMNAILRRLGSYKPRSFERHLEDMQKDADSAMRGAANLKDIMGLMNKETVGLDGSPISGYEAFQQKALYLAGIAKQEGRDFDYSKAMEGFDRFNETVAFYTTEIEKLNESAEALGVAANTALRNEDFESANKYQKQQEEKIKQREAVEAKLVKETADLAAGYKELGEVITHRGGTAPLDLARIDEGYYAINERQKPIKSILTDRGMDTSTMLPTEIDNMVLAFMGGNLSTMKNVENTDEATQLFEKFLQNQTHLSKSGDYQDAFKLVEVIQKSLEGTHLGRHSGTVSNFIVSQLKESMVEEKGKPGALEHINRGAYYQGGEEELRMYTARRTAQALDSGVANALGAAIALGVVSYEDLERGTIDDPVLQSLLSGEGSNPEKAVAEWSKRKGITPDQVRQQLYLRNHNLDLVASNEYAQSTSLRMSQAVDLNYVPMGGSPEARQLHETLMSDRGKDIVLTTHKFMSAYGNQDKHAGKLMNILRAAEAADAKAYDVAIAEASELVKRFLTNRGVDVTAGLNDPGMRYMITTLKADAQRGGVRDIGTRLNWSSGIPVGMTKEEQEIAARWAEAQAAEQSRLFAMADTAKNVELSSAQAHKQLGWFGSKTDYISSTWRDVRGTKATRQQMDRYRTIVWDELEKRGISKEETPELAAFIEQDMNKMELLPTSSGNLDEYLSTANNAAHRWASAVEADPQPFLNEKTRELRNELEDAEDKRRLTGSDLEEQKKRRGIERFETERFERQLKAARNPLNTITEEAIAELLPAAGAKGSKNADKKDLTQAIAKGRELYAKMGANDAPEVKRAVEAELKSMEQAVKDDKGAVPPEQIALVAQTIERTRETVSNEVEKNKEETLKNRIDIKTEIELYPERYAARTKYQKDLDRLKTYKSAMEGFNYEMGGILGGWSPNDPAKQKEAAEAFKLLPEDLQREIETRTRRGAEGDPNDTHREIITAVSEAINEQEQNPEKFIDQELLKSRGFLPVKLSPEDQARRDASERIQNRNKAFSLVKFSHDALDYDGNKFWKKDKLIERAIGAAEHQLKETPYLKEEDRNALLSQFGKLLENKRDDIDNAASSEDLIAILNENWPKLIKTDIFSETEDTEELARELSPAEIAKARTEKEQAKVLEAEREQFFKDVGVDPEETDRLRKLAIKGKLTAKDTQEAAHNVIMRMVNSKKFTREEIRGASRNAGHMTFKPNEFVVQGQIMEAAFKGAMDVRYSDVETTHDEFDSVKAKEQAKAYTSALDTDSVASGIDVGKENVRTYEELSGAAKQNIAKELRSVEKSIAADLTERGVPADRAKEQALAIAKDAFKRFVSAGPTIVTDKDGLEHSSFVDSLKRSIEQSVVSYEQGQHEARGHAKTSAEAGRAAYTSAAADKARKVVKTDASKEEAIKSIMSDKGLMEGFSALDKANLKAELEEAEVGYSAIEGDHFGDQRLDAAASMIDTFAAFAANKEVAAKKASNLEAVRKGEVIGGATPSRRPRSERRRRREAEPTELPEVEVKPLPERFSFAPDFDISSQYAARSQPVFQPVPQHAVQLLTVDSRRAVDDSMKKEVTIQASTVNLDGQLYINASRANFEQTALV